MPYLSDQDKLDRFVNAFATQSFRDQADRDYIAARMACRAELMPQFLWSSQQAVEKYLKAILLYNRIRVPKLTHEVGALLQMTAKLPPKPFAVTLCDRSRAFIDQLSQCGVNRYILKPYVVVGHILIDLDITVWELRRYCQVLNVFGRAILPAEQEQIERALRRLESSDAQPRHQFHLDDGFIEKALSDPKHPARTALLWNNATYASRRRATVKVRCHLAAEHPMLYLFPELLDELIKYTPLPRELEKTYRQHLSSIQADPSERP